MFTSCNSVLREGFLLWYTHVCLSSSTGFVDATHCSWQCLSNQVMISGRRRYSKVCWALQSNTYYTLTFKTRQISSKLHSLHQNNPDGWTALWEESLASWHISQPILVFFSVSELQRCSSQWANIALDTRQTTLHHMRISLQTKSLKANQSQLYTSQDHNMSPWDDVG